MTKFKYIGPSRWVSGVNILFFFLFPLFFMKLWEWHVAETFNIMPLSYGEAFGLSIITTLATKSLFRNAFDWDREKWDVFSLTVVFNGLFLFGLGWLVQVLS